jgi:hypothetical protein
MSASFPASSPTPCPSPTKNYARRCTRFGRCIRSTPLYGQPGFDPPPHATLGRYEGPTPITSEQAKERVERLLPVHCVITEATLQEEYEPDRMRIRDTFPFAGAEM